jgi:hypothetical protein
MDKKLTDHPEPDENQDTESQPMIDSLDQRLKRSADQPADHRHESLENPEEDGHFQDIFPFQFPAS